MTCKTWAKYRIKKSKFGFYHPQIREWWSLFLLWDYISIDDVPPSLHELCKSEIIRFEKLEEAEEFLKKLIELRNKIIASDSIYYDKKGKRIQ